MKINTENPADAISNDRPQLKTNTIKQYVIHLNKLKKLFSTDNYDFLSNPDEVMDKIKSNHYTSQRNTLNAVIILLLALNHDKKYDELIEDYQKRRDKLNDKYLEDNSNGKISEAQKNNFVDLEEIKKMLKTMENEIKSQGLKKKENLTGKEKELLMVYTIFSMLVKYPVRLDFSGMKLISKTMYNSLKEDDKKLGNYLINEKGKLTMIMNEYKTSKKYGEKKIPIDKDIEKVIRMYIRKTGKSNGDVLFVSSTGNAISRNALSQLLVKTTKKYLGKSISTTMMRKIVVSSVIPKEVIDKQKELADVMGHDVATQNLVYNKEE
jgi:integrase